MATSKRLCVLVVEDHEDTLKAMVRLLEHRGYRVRAASTFQEAEEFAANGDCELLISDVGLPEHSGFELMRDLKLRYGLKGIAVTGYLHPQHIQAATEAGFERVIAKPFAMEQLVKAIEEVSREPLEHPLN